MNFRKYTFGEWLRIIGVDVGAVVFILALPATKILPYWVGWENGPVEMAQNAVLIAGIVMAAREFFRAQTIEAKKTWLTLTGFMVVLLARELSLGRVFFFRGYDAVGPLFIEMKDMPGHTLIYILFGALMIAVAYGLMRYIPYRRIFAEHRQWPMAQIVMMFAFAVLAQFGEHLHGDGCETAEEIAELWVYILFLGVVHEFKPLLSGQQFLNSRQLT